MNKLLDKILFYDEIMYNCCNISIILLFMTLMYFKNILKHINIQPEWFSVVKNVCDKTGYKLAS